LSETVLPRWDAAGGRPSPVLLGGRGLDRSELRQVVDQGRPLALREGARERMQASHDALCAWLRDGVHVYGASSGVGDFAVREVGEAAWSELQLNVIRSHGCGAGPPVPARIVRGALALRATTLSRGYSAVRPELVELIVEMVNRRVHPVVPVNGSVGASGDTVLLAHAALVVVGEGAAQVGEGAARPGREALAAAGLQPLDLRPREGLALVNGLDFTHSAAACLATDTTRLMRWAEGIAALSADALCASPEPFLSAVQQLRGGGAHLEVADRVRVLLDGSRWIGSAEGTQDPYCLRCIPQVHGATWEVLDHFQRCVDLELEAVIDNPLVAADEDRAYHAGLFHGQRLAMASDYLALALVTLMNVSYARISLLLRGHRGLPPVLALDGGAENGLMATGTTSASVVGRARALSAPISIQNLNATALQEDHVSMSWETLVRSRSLWDDLSTLLAIEAMAAARAAALRGGPQGLGRGSAAIFRRISDLAPPRLHDAPIHAEIESLRSHLRQRECPDGPFDSD
jgi:histidine ammonia-lyase